MPKKYLTWGMSWPDPALLEAAKAKAKADGRSLSNYICRLIKDDLDSQKAAPPGATVQDGPQKYPALDRKASSLNEPSSAAKMKALAGKIAGDAKQASASKRKG